MRIAFKRMGIVNWKNLYPMSYEVFSSPGWQMTPESISLKPWQPLAIAPYQLVRYIKNGVLPGNPTELMKESKLPI